MKVAALDLGSNTSLLLIAEVEAGKITQVYHDECRLTRLGQGVDEKREFHPEALARAEECLRHYGEVIGKHKPERVMAVATSAARDVKNREDLFTIAAKYSIPLKVISGDMEASVTFKGALSNLVSSQECRVIDVGGGSTEIICGTGEGRLVGQSLDLGCVRLTEQFISQQPIAENEIFQMRESVQAQLGSLKPEIKSSKGPLVAVAGTPTTLAAVILGVEFDAEKIHGFEISLEALEQWLTQLAAMTLAERSKLPGMEPLRADVIVTGLVILGEVTRYLGGSSFLVSTRGVRYGLAQELANENSSLSSH